MVGAEFNCYAPPGGTCSNYPEKHRHEVLKAFGISEEKMQSLANASAKAWPCQKRFCDIEGGQCRQRETVPLTGPKFLNAGFIVGPAGKLVEVLKKVIKLF